MNLRKLLFSLVFIGFLPLITIAQNETNPPVFVPEEGIEGKDVIWWPTPPTLVKAMVDKANVGPNDIVVDLGSGDGRIVIEAAKRGAHATGIEFNPDLVKLSEYRADTAGVAQKAKFLNMDLFEYDLSRATVITMYLLSDLNLKLRPKLLQLKPGTRIVSNTFDLGDWEADENITVTTPYTNDDGSFRHNFTNRGYYWVVPAKVDGIWDFRDGKLNLTQKYQVLQGAYLTSHKTIPIEGGRLSGNEVSFEIDGIQYKGTVENNRMIGTYTDGNTEKEWKAIKGPKK